MAAWPHLEGSKYAEGVFPAPIELPDGTAAHLYAWGERTHAPVPPAAEGADAVPIALSALGMALPPPPPPPPPAMADPPGPLRPKSPGPSFPLSHTLPCDPHICLGAACTLFGSLPGEHLVFHAEPYVKPPEHEAMVGCVPSIDGANSGPMSPVQLAESLFYQRKKWADAKDFHDTPRVLSRMFELDWRRATEAGLVKLPLEGLESKDATERRERDNAEALLEEEEMLDVRNALFEHKAAFYAAYYHYAALGAADLALFASETAEEAAEEGEALVEVFGDDHASLPYHAFALLAKECELAGDELPCTADAAEAAYTWATREDAKPAWALRREEVAAKAAKAAKERAKAELLRRRPSDDDDDDDESFVQPLLAADDHPSGVLMKTLGFDPRTGAPLTPTKPLYRYQFLQCLVKLAASAYLGSESEEIADAVEKLLQEQLVRTLPPAVLTDQQELRETTLYTLDIEAVLRANLETLASLFGGYARGGPGADGELLSLPEWLTLLAHLDLYDAEFTAKDATLAFLHSRMRVVDEIKARVRVTHLSLVDFCEALTRVALAKKLPTPDILRKAGRRTAGEYYLELRAGATEVYAGFLRSHAEQAATSGNPLGMRPNAALEALFSVATAVVRNSAGSAGPLTPDEVRNFFARAEAKLSGR